MTVHAIVVEYLKANGYDGLVSFMGGCSCVVDDLMPCTFDYDYDYIASCTAEYKVPCNPETCQRGGDWVRRKP